ncbi:uncharacterized protein Z518_03682 [Rhinocladiella mackenziei CBS 650.93]|uniref:Glucuronyl hydrolase n=1 Tax=Rhinocladiella mackenziei CBS 650.93 TaxID=1442369 RepID=A0A0D2J9B0_9EURO|nr:uncharacterized protein Z518_03682 [Rhinocladiella mackenziei CBS 650.93]KIX05710.1 hypothetical protein Z518_03682 [Rhinocladiella mackenziei CBS 650.93]
MLAIPGWQRPHVICYASPSTNAAFKGPIPSYPESAPQSGAGRGRYEYRDAEFWTCGFFPGTVYTLLERAAKFPAHVSAPKWYREHLYSDLLTCGRHWSIALNDMSSRTDTHDMGFIVQPALQKDWEMTGNLRSLDSVTKAAYALASRYDPAIGAIRSWDRAINHRYRIDDMTENFLVIIDSMCNLDLLFYIGHLVHDESLASIATTHANTVRRTILREDCSTFHLVNLDPRRPGEVISRMTNQGYNDASTWSRGQAWAIMGFAQTYLWTKDSTFLKTAIGCANLFLSRLDAASHHHPFVPAWDFDAHQEDPAEPLRDTSAGVIAANGMLLIHQALQSLSVSSISELSYRPVAGGSDFLDAALLIVQETLDMSLDRDFASLLPPLPLPSSSPGEKLHAQISPSSFDAILRNATANNNEHAHKRYWDHGLVYADYFLLEFGNKLCRMGLC